MLRAVLFDLGDTLQEYDRQDWDAITAELNRELYDYLEARGQTHRLPPLDRFLEIINARSNKGWAEARRTLRGHSMLEMLQRLLDEYGVEEMTADECLPTWYGPVVSMTHVEPDVVPTLRLLRESGLKLGLVSNTGWPAAAHDRDLERFGLKDLLDCRLYSCEVGWEKPAPQIFRAALECMGTKPEATVFVGDFLRYDVVGAQRAGMKAVWKRLERRPAELDDRTIVPEATITRIGELPEVLARLFGWEPGREQQH